ncbi:MAG TPA: hypothetical protein VL993_06830 [Stellaceae bacterium]|nr:hypothetical protein [Stellaceae bacterium]
MRHYKLYFMVQARIVEGLDLACADDDTAQRIADQRLARANPTYDAIETWQGLRLVCRRERAFEVASRGSDSYGAALRI